MKQANEWLMRVVKGMLAIGVAPIAMAASEVCVSTATELNVALTLAQFAPQTIKLVQGTYSLTDSIWHNADPSVVTIRAGSSLRGGYLANCTGRDIAAENTVMTDSPGATDTVGFIGDLTVEGLSWHTGLSLEADYSGPDIDPDSVILISRDVFEGPLNGGLQVLRRQNEAMKLRIVDTLIHDSHGVLNGNASMNCALNVDTGFTAALEVELINSTVMSNPASDGGACFERSSVVAGAYNNIFYGNSSPDLYSESNELFLVNNTIGTHHYPSLLFPPVGTVTGNPQLDANFRPVEPGSPVINSGTEDVSGGLPVTDLDGRARVIGGAPDRGAYESNINDAFVQTVTNTNDSGSGSLREALINANAASGFNLISFDIGSSCGPHVITLASPLPSITSSVFINGYSQTGASQNDLDSGDDAVICVILKSGDASASTGLRVGPSASSAVYLKAVGMAFSGFSYAALDLKGGSNHVVAGNHFGGNVGGVGLMANDTNVLIGTGISGATIGGDDVSQRNIISGATSEGVLLGGPANGQLGANHNQVINNYIGTTHTGNAAFGNSNGVFIQGDHNTLQHNLISGNTSNGVFLTGAGAHNNLIDSNNVGSTDFGNGESGISIDNAAQDNTIIYNTIVNNAGRGVRIETGIHNKISHNSISGNSLLGIDLAGAGVTANDDDSGIRPIDYANDGLNFPVLTQATGGALNGVVGATLTTVAGIYFVELFVNGSCDGSGYGQGEHLRGSIEVIVPDAPFGNQGTVSFTTSLSHGSDPTLLGKFISATATSLTGDTSEFSACMLYTSDTIFADSFE